ncbi:MAG: siroheme decarboxylase subunit beta [Candidatus Humimicrobiaceae bacterium]
MTDLEKEIVQFIQDDIPLVTRPLKELARKIKLSEKEIVILLKDWHDTGLLRRLGVFIQHQKAGFRANGMSVWIIPKDQIVSVGQLMVSFPQVGHCYQRPTYPGWPYNMFAMIHEQSRDAVMQVAQKISLAIDIKQYDILFTEKEFKKNSMKYFINEIPMETEKYNV